MSALDRLRTLQANLQSLDSGSGEAKDLALALAVIEAAKELASVSPIQNSPLVNNALDSLDRALTALTEEK